MFMLGIFMAHSMFFSLCAHIGILHLFILELLPQIEFCNITDNKVGNVIVV